MQKSPVTSWNGLVGGGLVMIGVCGLDGNISWHVLHDRITLSISLSMPGH